MPSPHPTSYNGVPENSSCTRDLMAFLKAKAGSTAFPGRKDMLIISTLRCVDGNWCINPSSLALQVR